VDFRKGKIIQLAIGLIGVVVLAIGGSSLMFSLHWIFWNPLWALNPPSEVEWFVLVSAPFGFLMVGLGLLLIFWSRLISVIEKEN